MAKELQADDEGAAGGEPNTNNGTAKKRQTEKPLAKRPRAAAKKASQDQDSDEEDEEGKMAKPSKRPKTKSADTEEQPVIEEEIRKAAQKLKEASKNDGSPAPELPKGQKKGTARVVKKDGLRGGGEEEVEKTKGKGKVKGKTVKAEESEDDGDAGADLGEMQFELEYH